MDPQPTSPNSFQWLQIARNPNAGACLHEAIIGARFDGADPNRMRHILDDWTNTDEFFEMFGAARNGHTISDEQFASALSQSPALRGSADPYGAARYLVYTLGQSWLAELQMASTGTSGAKTTTPTGAPRAERWWLSMIVSVVAVLGVLFGAFALVLLLGGSVVVATKFADALPIAGAALFVIALIGSAFVALQTWLSYQLFERKSWARPVHVALTGLALVSGASSLLFAPSALGFIGVLLNIGFIWVLVQPETVEEFSGKTKTNPNAPQMPAAPAFG